MLQMRKTCELCGRHLAADGEVYICSYECTYCAACYAGLEACPNCAGEVVRRPRRTTGAVQIATRLPGRAARLVRRVTGR